jgi:NADPH2 dehydrogenase
VHSKGSYIYLQLWALGRGASPKVLEDEGPYPYVAASDVPLSGSTIVPRPLTSEGVFRYVIGSDPSHTSLVSEIKEYVQLYVIAAVNAVHIAGFDGVEVDGAHGYLIDQFLQDMSNKRIDEYGGSIENRARFFLEVVGAVVKEVGAEKTGVRLSPWSTHNGGFSLLNVHVNESY